MFKHGRILKLSISLFSLHISQSCCLFLRRLSFYGLLVATQGQVVLTLAPVTVPSSRNRTLGMLMRFPRFCLKKTGWLAGMSSCRRQRHAPGDRLAHPPSSGHQAFLSSLDVNSGWCGHCRNEIKWLQDTASLSQSARVHAGRYV